MSATGVSGLASISFFAPTMSCRAFARLFPQFLQPLDDLYRTVALVGLELLGDEREVLVEIMVHVELDDITLGLFQPLREIGFLADGALLRGREMIVEFDAQPGLDAPVELVDARAGLFLQVATQLVGPRRDAFHDALADLLANRVVEGFVRQADPADAGLLLPAVGRGQLARIGMVLDPENRFGMGEGKAKQRQKQDAGQCGDALHSRGRSRPASPGKPSSPSPRSSPPSGDTSGDMPGDTSAGATSP